MFTARLFHAMLLSMLSFLPIHAMENSIAQQIMEKYEKGLYVAEDQQCKNAFTIVLHDPKDEYEYALDLTQYCDDTTKSYTACILKKTAYGFYITAMHCLPNARYYLEKIEKIRKMKRREDTLDCPRR